MTENTIFDPLRNKYVARTPEEEVRQWFITVLRDSLGVPAHMMRSEFGFAYGRAAKKYRADIVIFGRDASPAAVVECKRPEVELTQTVLEQALRYDMVLTVRWIIVTNGTRTFAARREGGTFKFQGALPSYEQIIS